MFSFYYVMHSKQDGQYLFARPNRDSNAKYLLVFTSHADALGYLNAHAQEVSKRFSVQSIPTTQLRIILDRWEFHGYGMVEDALLPKIQFLQRSP